MGISIKATLVIHFFSGGDSRCQKPIRSIFASGLPALSRLAGPVMRCRAFQRVGSFVVRLMKSFRATGRLAPKPSSGRRHAKLDPHRAFLIARVEAKADITMPELSAELAKATGTRADPASLSRWLIRNGYRFKKNFAGSRARSSRHQSGVRRMDNHTPAAHAA